MVLVDDRILEFCNEYGPVSPTTFLEKSKLEYSRPYINNRMRMLQDAGFLLMLGNGVYDISELGQNYLLGEIEAPGITEIEE